MALVTYGPKLKPSRVFEYLTRVLRTNIKQASMGRDKTPVVIWGPRGVGKTDIVCRKMVEEGIVKYAKEIPLSQIEEAGDIHGLPEKATRDSANGEQELVTVMAPPAWVPNEQGAGILCFDDFNRATPRIIKVIMQLMQRHRTISWALPQACSIVLTANPEGGGDYNVTPLDIAQLSRCRHVTLEVDKLDWLYWAAAHGIDSRVMNFIAKYEAMLSPSDQARTCPRTWAMLAADIAELDQEYIKGSEGISTLDMLGRALLDDEAVAAFITFVRGEMDMIVEPELIVEKYTDVRDKVLDPLKRNPPRLDMINVMVERVIVYLEAKPAAYIKEGNSFHANIIRFLEEDKLPKEFKFLAVRELCHRKDSKLKGKIISDKLALELGDMLTGGGRL